MQRLTCSTITSKRIANRMGAIKVMGKVGAANGLSKTLLVNFPQRRGCSRAEEFSYETVPEGCANMKRAQGTFSPAECSRGSTN